MRRLPKWLAAVVSILLAACGRAPPQEPTAPASLPAEDEPAASDTTEEAERPASPDPSVRTAEEVFQDVLRRHGRTAYVPRLSKGLAPSPGLQFGGRPWLPEGTTWPKCGCCAEELPLFVQLDFAALPEGAPMAGKTGLLQVFYCTNEEADCENEDSAYFPDTNLSKLLRVVDPTGPGAVAPTDLARHGFGPRHATGWRELPDAPANWDVLDELSDEEMALYEEASETAREWEFPLAFDKVGGWPRWLNIHAEWEDCRVCGERMEVILQLHSEDGVQHEFGDSGIAHIHICPRHPERPIMSQTY